MENLEQGILRQTFRRPGGGVDLPEGKTRLHEAVGHGGKMNLTTVEIKSLQSGETQNKPRRPTAE